jgi:hypothetical protein
MHSGAKIEKVDGMGDYKAHLTPDMAGDWSVDLSYQGPKGPGEAKSPGQQAVRCPGFSPWRIPTFPYSG